MAEVKIINVVKNAAQTCGEGPHWDEATKTLYFVDIIVGTVGKWNSVTNEVKKVKFDGFVSFVILDKEGKVVIGHDQTIERFEWDNPEVREIIAKVDQEEDKVNATRFNDAKCDSSGRLWAGTMGLEVKPCALEPEMGSLYLVDKNHEVFLRQSKVTLSNGLAWSADDKKMYFAESVPGIMYSYDYDKASGELKNRKEVFKPLSTPLRDDDIPDGMAMDTNGKLWLACYNSHRVYCINPETGKSERHIDMPVRNPTSCCFGGPNYDELYVTSSAAYYKEEDWKVDPDAGSIFKMTGLGVKGFAPAVYQG